jgi:hypothetical protein
MEAGCASPPYPFILIDSNVIPSEARNLLLANVLDYYRHPIDINYFESVLKVEKNFAFLKIYYN